RILCIEKFGAERSPSRTGLSRALKKIQNQKTYLR
ncbi:primosomal protein, partial [Vibrio cholerae]